MFLDEYIIVNSFINYHIQKKKKRVKETEFIYRLSL